MGRGVGAVLAIKDAAGFVDLDGVPGLGRYLYAEGAFSGAYVITRNLCKAGFVGSNLV